MYKENFVACIKTSEGKILREDKDVIKLPFGSEYSIYLKNLNSRKAKVNISIDGTDVLDGDSLVVNGNDISEVEGFLKNGVAKNKFKFIEKTKEISEFRGDKIDDGIIRIEFTFEKEKPIVRDVIYNLVYTTLCDYTYHNDNITYCQSNTISENNSVQSKSINLDCLRSMDLQNNNINDQGITVKGSEIQQNFVKTNMDTLEEVSHVIILKLIGYKKNNEKVEQPITVDKKIQCNVCGKVCEYIDKFCSRCGTYLEK
jgi:hypothetical protein